MFTGIQHYAPKGQALCGNRNSHLGVRILSDFYALGVKRCKNCLLKLHQIEQQTHGRAGRRYSVGVVETQQTFDVLASTPQSAYDQAEKMSITAGKGNFSDRTVGVKEVR